MVSDDIDISETSNSANLSCRQNISDGCSARGMELDGIRRDPAVEDGAGVLVLGQRDAQFQSGFGHCSDSRHRAPAFSRIRAIST